MLSAECGVPSAECVFVVWGLPSDLVSIGRADGDWTMPKIASLRFDRDRVISRAALVRVRSEAGLTRSCLYLRWWRSGSGNHAFAPCLCDMEMSLVGGMMTGRRVAN